MPKRNARSENSPNCAEGIHGPFIDGATVEYDMCVNTEMVCASCGIVWGDLSISKEGPELEDTNART